MNSNFPPCCHSTVAITLTTRHGSFFQKQMIIESNVLALALVSVLCGSYKCQLFRREEE